MNILIINQTIDCAGGKILINDAINKFTKHKSRHLLGRETYLCYKTDLVLGKVRSLKQLVELVEKADVLWFHLWDFNCPFGPINWKYFLEGKKVLFNPQSSNEYMKPRHKAFKEGLLYGYYDNLPVQVVVFHGTDLEVYKGSKWGPIVKPINDPPYLPESSKTFDGELIIGQSPSKTQMKNTKELVDVVEGLKTAGYPIKLDILSGISHEECLKRRRHHHISFDNLTQGHPGSSGWESLSLGIPTLVRIDKREMDVLTEFAEGNPPPFINVDSKEDMYNEFKKLILDRDKLKSLSFYCRQWMEKYYKEERLIKYWLKIIEATPRGPKEVNINLKPLTDDMTSHPNIFYRIMWKLNPHHYPQKPMFHIMLFILSLKWRLRLLRDSKVASF